MKFEQQNPGTKAQNYIKKKTQPFIVATPKIEQNHNSYKIERFSSPKKKKKTRLRVKNEPVGCGPEGNRTCLNFFLT